MVVRARIRLRRPRDPLHLAVEDGPGPARARLPRRADHQRVLDAAAGVAPVRRRDLRAPGPPVRAIMSAAPIPKTAPFADDEIEVLNRVVGTATPIQRAWLAGFLAGLDAQQGGGAAKDAVAAGPPQEGGPP